VSKQVVSEVCSKSKS